MRPPAPALLKQNAIARHEDPETVWLEVDDVIELGSALPADVERAIRATARNLDDLDPHSLIGVDHDASWTEIELAYRQRLAIFHPHRWSGYDLADLRDSMEQITLRISFAFAFLAEEAAQDGTLGSPEQDAFDRATAPVDADEGDRPTYPCSVVQPIPRATTGRRPCARPPRPPPRKTG